MKIQMQTLFYAVVLMYLCLVKDSLICVGSPGIKCFVFPHCDIFISLHDQEKNQSSWAKCALLSWHVVLTKARRKGNICQFLRNHSFSHQKPFHLVHIFLYSNQVSVLCWRRSMTHRQVMDAGYKTTAKDHTLCVL